MDAKAREHFAAIVSLASTVLEQVEYSMDITLERAILRLQAQYGVFRIIVSELIQRKARKYRYYVLQENRVEAGFDNAPDSRAIRLKYGRIGSQHAGELVPHLHLEDKTQIVLTDEITFEEFIKWLQANL